MKINDNQKYIYIRSTRERIPVTQEEFDAYYHDIDIFRIRQQRHGRCVCPEAKRLDCDMDCVTCPFRRAGDLRSLDIKGVGGNSWMDEYPDFSATPHEMAEEQDLMSALKRVLAELNEEDRAICDTVMNALPERDAAEVLGIPRSTYNYRRNKLYDRLRKILKEFL